MIFSQLIDKLVRVLDGYVQANAPKTGLMAVVSAAKNFATDKDVKDKKLKDATVLLAYLHGLGKSKLEFNAITELRNKVVQHTESATKIRQELKAGEYDAALQLCLYTVDRALEYSEFLKAAKIEPAVAKNNPRVILESNLLGYLLECDIAFKSEEVSKGTTWTWLPNLFSKNTASENPIARILEVKALLEKMNQSCANLDPNALAYTKALSAMVTAALTESQEKDTKLKQPSPFTTLLENSRKVILELEAQKVAEDRKLAEEEQTRKQLAQMKADQDALRTKVLQEQEQAETARKQAEEQKQKEEHDRIEAARKQAEAQKQKEENEKLMEAQRVEREREQKAKEAAAQMAIATAAAAKPEPISPGQFTRNTGVGDGSTTRNMGIGGNPRMGGTVRRGPHFIP